MPRMGIIKNPPKQDTPPAAPPGKPGDSVDAGSNSLGIPDKCPSCGKKVDPSKGDSIYDCKDGVQRCEKCYKDWMKDQWKASGKQKKHNKDGGPRARFVIRVRKA